MYRFDDLIEVRGIYCFSGKIIQWFNHFLSDTVRPEISLKFSSNPVVIGSSVNVTCTAKSYPKADPNISKYVIEHPVHNALDDISRAPGEYGYIHEIQSASKEDNGTYACHVTVFFLTDSVDDVLTNRTEADLYVQNGI